MDCILIFPLFHDPGSFELEQSSADACHHVLHATEFANSVGRFSILTAKENR